LTDYRIAWLQKAEKSMLNIKFNPQHFFHSSTPEPGNSEQKKKKLLKTVFICQKKLLYSAKIFKL